jgi:hypothetical protein
MRVRRFLMTEAEWLASTDVRAMYVFLGDIKALFRTRWQGYRAVPRLAVSHRKLCLFAVACCRRVLHLVPVEAARHVVEVTERYADGLASREELQRAVEASASACADHSQRLAVHGSYLWRHEREALQAVSHVHRPEAALGPISRAAATAWVWAAAVQQSLEGEDPGRALIEAEYAHQAGLLRDIVGNPFRRPAVYPSWLAWNERCVERMARGIYEERAFDRLPILHDALLDAGCDDDLLLAHCRTPQGHVRGCWVIDLLLGKE